MFSNLKMIIVGFCLLMAGGTMAAVPEKVTFVDHVMPILREHCLACHDQGGKSGDLSLETYNDTMTGGASGQVVEPGAGDSSRLYQLMAHIEKPIMPPGQDKLPDEQLAMVKAWIDGGLLENAGSKAKKSKRAAVAAFVPSADNRPEGAPAMPGGFFRQPVLHSPVAGAVADVATSPWSPLVAITGQRQVSLYHTETRELLAVVPFVVGSPEVVRFSRNGDLLLVAGGRGAKLGTAHLWDIKTGKRISEIGDELDTLLAADISADHSFVAFGGPRRRVQVHRTADGELAYSITKHTDWVTALEFSPDGTLLVTADRSGNAHVWEAATGRAVADLTGHKAAITAVSWRGDSRLVATVGDAGEVRTWQRNGNPAKTWRGGGSLQDVCFTKDGRLVTVGRDGQAKLWNVDGKQLKTLGKADDVALAIAPTFDNRLAVFADWTGTVRVADIEASKVVDQLSANPPMLHAQLKSAEEQIKQTAASIEPARQQLAAATSNLEAAKAEVKSHGSQVKNTNESIAKLDQQLATTNEQWNTLSNKQKQTTERVTATRDEQKKTEAEVASLRQQLAAIGNQQQEEADGAKTAELEAKINATQTKLASLQSEHKDLQTQRSKLADERKKLKSTMDSQREKLGEQKQVLRDLMGKAKQLPKVEELTAERDRLQKELDAKSAAHASAQAKVSQLHNEIQAYTRATDELAGVQVKNQQAMDSLTTQLADAQANKSAKVEELKSVESQVQKLKEELAQLEQKKREATAAKQAAEQSMDTVEQGLGDLAAEAEKLRRAQFDLQEAAKLRQQNNLGN